MSEYERLSDAEWQIVQAFKARCDTGPGGVRRDALLFDCGRARGRVEASRGISSVPFALTAAAALVVAFVLGWYVRPFTATDGSPVASSELSRPADRAATKGTDMDSDEAISAVEEVDMTSTGVTARSWDVDFWDRREETIVVGDCRENGMTWQVGQRRLN